MKNCCKEWVLKASPKQDYPLNHIGFEEQHTCPDCHTNYLLWFTCIGDPRTKSVQIVPITVRPVTTDLDAAGSMQHLANRALGQTPQCQT